MRAVREEARVRVARRITLVTVDFVPWTVGFYGRLGFRSLAARELDARWKASLGLSDEDHRPEARSFGGRAVLVRAKKPG